MTVEPVGATSVRRWHCVLGQPDAPSEVISHTHVPGLCYHDEPIGATSVKRRRGLRWWLTVLTLGVPEPPPVPPLTPAQRREDALLDEAVQMYERAALPCTWCEDIGEPHVCEREWWRKRLAHYEGRECSDDECLCHEGHRLRRESDALLRLVAR